MDIVKNCRTGKLHIALSGTDSTLCGVHDLAARCRANPNRPMRESNYDEHGNWIGWEEGRCGVSLIYVRRFATCRLCNRISKMYL